MMKKTARFNLRGNYRAPIWAMVLLCAISVCHLSGIRAINRSQRNTTRSWLDQAQRQLQRLLPNGPASALITDDLVDVAGRAVNIATRFGVNTSQAEPLKNIAGLLTSAAAAGIRWDNDPRAAWPGFEDVWVPINDRLQLSGRLGLADGGGPADCLIFVPGLFGDNTSPQTRNVAMALRARGFHVLALEGRAAGLTEERFPNVAYSFGVHEAGDLLAVDEWLMNRSDVRRTGLIGFCWGANTALLAAWEDARRDDDPDVPPRLARHLRPRDGREHFQAGVVACSPPVHFDDVVQRLEQPVISWSDPAYAYLAQVVETRMQLKGDPSPGHSLLQLMNAEVQRGGEFTADEAAESKRYLRLISPGRMESKLDAVRVPTLILFGVDDPIAAAQPVADLVAQSRNPQVAAVVLAGGGHCGFAAYAPDYFYGLITRFFERRTDDYRPGEADNGAVTSAGSPIGVATVVRQAAIVKQN